MAIAYVQAPAAATVFSGTTISLAFGSNVTAGSMLCAHINANHGISGVADSRSQTYTSAVNVTDGATYSLATYYFLNTTGGACTVTVTFAGAVTFASLQVAEYSGVATSSALDKTANNSQTDPGTAADAITSGSVTPTTDGQLILGWTSALVVGGSTVSAGSGFTGRINVFGDILFEDQIQTSAGAIAATFTTTSATADFITLVSTYKAAAAAGTAPKRLTMLGVG